MSQSKRRVRILDRDDEQDLLNSQIIIVAARWILVALGLVLTMWDPSPISELRIQIMALLVLAGVNFYMHAQVLMKQPTISEVVYAASMADVVAITVFIIVGGGFESSVYTFYFPTILAFSVAFRTDLTRAFTLSTVSMYSFICLISLSANGPTGDDLSVIATRSLMLIAVAFCGNMYWQIERQRREEAEESRDMLMTEIEERAARAGSEQPAEATN